MKKTPDLRPATAHDVAAFTNGKMTMTCQAIVADLDGEIIGIGGVYFTGAHVVAFSDFKKKMLDYPFTMARAVKMIMKIVQERPCIAIADKRHASAFDLLQRCGFRRVHSNVFEYSKEQRT
jgi:hypothetical protein